MATTTYTNYVWTEWASSSSTCSSTSTTSGEWQYWNTTDCTCSSSTDCTWNIWTTEDVSSDTYYLVDTSSRRVWTKWVDGDNYPSQPVSIPPVEYKRTGRVILNKKPVLSTEQIRARRVQLEINSIWSDLKYKELQEEKEAAEEVAMEMLGDLIGDDQLKVYKETGRLLVHGKTHDWLLRKGGIIAKVEKGKLIDHCVHLARQHSYPPTDNVITLALLLKDDDKRVERIANRHAMEKSADELLKAANY